jgi:hypothetical protein
MPENLNENILTCRLDKQSEAGRLEKPKDIQKDTENG